MGLKFSFIFLSFVYELSFIEKLRAKLKTKNTKVEIIGNKIIVSLFPKRSGVPLKLK